MPQQQPQIERGIGSGVIISPDGYIVTNNHVVDGATEIKVTLSDRRIMTAKLVGTDPADRSGCDQDRRHESAEHSDRRLLQFEAGTDGPGFRQSLRIPLHRYSRDRECFESSRIRPPIPASPDSLSRPMRRSTPAIQAARWSMLAEKWWASTRSCSRPRARSLEWDSLFRRRS